MLSLPDMGVILLVVLIVFGPGKLPDVGKALGSGIRHFKKAVEEEPEKNEALKLTEKTPAEEETQQPKV